MTIAHRPGEEAVPEHIDRMETALFPTLLIEGEALVTSSLKERMEHYGVPGVSVAVINAGKIEWTRSYGLADVESKKRVTPQTLFQAASISKPVAALAALRLVEGGLLTLDGDINENLRKWRPPANDLISASPVTLRGILTHTAGLTVPGFPGYGPGEDVPTTVGVLNGEGNTDPVLVDTEPRTQCRYSGGGYTVMQLLVEEVMAIPFAEAVNENVLKPLGMVNSTFEQPLPEKLREPSATGYLANGDPVAGGFHVYPELAAAGLWTTPADLARYLISIQRARRRGEHAVVSAEIIEQMLMPDTNNRGLGPGISADGLRFGHGGANAGFQCTMTAFIDRGQGIVVMTNSDRGGLLANEIVLTVAQACGWEGFEIERKVIARLSTAELQAIAGVYCSDFGQVRVEFRGGRLWVMPFWDETRHLELLPESKESFFAREGNFTAALIWDGANSVRGMRSLGLEFEKR